jgi:hypothetical protein
MTQSELGALVPCDKATVSRIEAGQAPDEAFARTCSEVFDNEWFIRFWKDSQTWGSAVFPQSLREFAAYETEALTLRLFEHSVVPGLLQVQAYAQAVLERHIDTSPEEAAERAAARVARQEVLDSDQPPRLWTLMDEYVLHHEIAPAKVMADQMGRLASMARRTYVTVQLISNRSAHVGLAGAFAVAETPDTTVAYVDHAADAMTTDSPATVSLLCSKFDTLRTEAYRGSESLIMIEEAAERWANS